MQSTGKERLSSGLAGNCDAGVLCGVIRAVDGRGLLFFIRFPYLFDGEDGRG